MFALMAFQAASEPIHASVRTSRTMRHMRESGKPMGSQPRGVTTDKQREDFDSDQSEMCLPELVDGEISDDFILALNVLNPLATTDKTPYQVGKSHDISSPDRAVKKM